MKFEQGDRLYHERRAAEEQVAALAARDSRARAAHDWLARLHRRAAARVPWAK